MKYVKEIYSYVFDPTYLFIFYNFLKNLPSYWIINKSFKNQYESGLHQIMDVWKRNATSGAGKMLAGTKVFWKETKM